MRDDFGLETKFSRLTARWPRRRRAREIAGYASLFGAADQGGDVVQAGAYARSLKRLAARAGG